MTGSREGKSVRQMLGLAPVRHPGSRKAPPRSMFPWCAAATEIHRACGSRSARDPRRFNPRISAKAFDKNVYEAAHVACHFECHCAGTIRKMRRTDETGRRGDCWLSRGIRRTHFQRRVISLQNPQLQPTPARRLFKGCVESGPASNLAGKVGAVVFAAQSATVRASKAIIHFERKIEHASAWRRAFAQEGARLVICAERLEGRMTVRLPSDGQVLKTTHVARLVFIPDPKQQPWLGIDAVSRRCAPEREVVSENRNRWRDRKTESRMEHGRVRRTG
jgi:hypothetical protein